MSRRILIVSKHHYIVEPVLDSDQDGEIDFFIASSDRQAFQLLLANDVDSVIYDSEDLQLKTLHFLRRVKRLNPDIPVVLVSNLDEKEFFFKNDISPRLVNRVIRREDVKKILDRAFGLS